MRPQRWSDRWEPIRELTGLLRTSDEPLWERLRLLLREKGIDPATTLLAECFPDDAELEFGLVVTQERRLFQFGLDYLHTTVEQGSFAEWVERTADVAGSPCRERAAAALELLAQAR